LREDADTKDLVLQYSTEEGKVKEEKFSMVVLSVGAEAAAGAKELAGLFGLTTDDFGFIRTPTLHPVATDKPGVFLAGTATGPVDLADSVTQGSAAAAEVCGFLGLSCNTAIDDVPRAEWEPEISSVTQEEQRTGVFVCDCAGEIGGVIDLKRVLPELSSAGGFVHSGILDYGCLPQGLSEIQQVIEDKGLTV
jgi:heterodisulfide reductase subunit A